MGSSWDALVVGAGPVGMTMALELQRHGLSVRIVDQNEAPTTFSKAQVVHARTLEILDDMGIVDALLPRGKKLRGVNVYDRDRPVAHLTVGGRVDSPHPFTLSVSQRDTELVLEEALRARGCPVERRVRLETFAREDAGIVAELVHEGDGGRREEVHASWLLGCDGAHSTVRKGLGLELEGSTYEFRLIQADIRVDGLPIEADDEVVAFLHPDGPLGFFPLPGEKRYRQLVFLPPGLEMEPTLESFQKAVDQRGPRGARVCEPAWMVGFRIHARLASRLRVGRVLLAGDAAHIHSPAGGQGMNMGMQDSYNLAWKLALVHKRVGRDALLDSYAAERHPIHRATLEATDAATRRMPVIFGFKNRLAQGLRNQLLGFVGGLGLVQDAVSRALSMIEIGYPESPIVDQWRDSVLDANVVTDRSSEAPSLGDFMFFGEGPAPGQRAVDAPITPVPTDGESPVSVFELFRGTHHTLLLFDGAAATPEGYANLARIATRAADRCRHHLRVHIVVPHADRPDALAGSASVIPDADGHIHRRYGARSECLYLIRPDGHVAFRAQPASERALLDYLERVFT